MQNILPQGLGQLYGEALHSKVLHICGLAGRTIRASSSLEDQLMEMKSIHMIVRDPLKKKYCNEQLSHI